MKLTAILTIKMKKGIFPQFISTLYKQQMEVSGVNLTETDGKWDGYSVEIIYSSKKDLVRIIEALKKNSDLFRDMSITSTLEDTIRGGLLSTVSKIQIETKSDIETSFLGGTSLIHEKVDSGFGKQYCAVSATVGIITVFRKLVSPAEDFYHLYADSERDAVIISRFTDKNAYPVAVKYQSVEDLLKTLKGIEESFSCLRIMNTDSEDLLFRESIINSLKKPVVFHELDELPMYLMTIISKTCKKHRLKPEETSVGILGLNHGLIRFTGLLSASGYMKVLGHDSRERTMMSFENSGGLATTVENVADNADILIIADDQFLQESIRYLNPGSVVIAGFSSDKIDPSLSAEKGLKEIVQIRTDDMLALIPPMINGISSGDSKSFSDELILKVASSAARELNEEYRFPGFFSEVQGKIESAIIRG